MKEQVKEPENKLQLFMDKMGGWSVAEVSRRSGLAEFTINKMLKLEKTSRRSKIRVAVPFEVPAKKIFPNDPEL